MSALTKLILPWQYMRNCKEGRCREDVENVKNSDGEHQIVEVTLVLLNRKGHQAKTVANESNKPNKNL